MAGSSARTIPPVAPAHLPRIAPRPCHVAALHLLLRIPAAAFCCSLLLAFLQPQRHLLGQGVGERRGGGGGQPPPVATNAQCVCVHRRQQHTNRNPSLHCHRRHGAVFMLCLKCALCRLVGVPAPPGMQPQPPASAAWRPGRIPYGTRPWRCMAAAARHQRATGMWYSVLEPHPAASCMASRHMGGHSPSQAAATPAAHTCVAASASFRARSGSPCLRHAAALFVRSAASCGCSCRHCPHRSAASAGVSDRIACSPASRGSRQRVERALLDYCGHKHARMHLG